MGTLVALYKPFDLSLQNLIKYKFLLYISFVLCLVLTVPFYPRKKQKQKQKQKKRKSRERVGREKGKKDHMYQLRYLLLACCSPLN